MCHFIISLSQNSVHTVVLHHYISINCRNIGDTGASCHMEKLPHRVKSQKLERFESKSNCTICIVGFNYCSSKYSPPAQLKNLTAAVNKLKM